MAQLTATGRTGKRYCEKLLLSGGDVRRAPLSLRRDLAVIAVERLMEPKQRSEHLLCGVVKQAIRDIGARPQDDSQVDWHHHHLDIYLEAFGVEPECVQGILEGLGLWEPEDIYRYPSSNTPSKMLDSMA